MGERYADETSDRRGNRDDDRPKKRVYNGVTKFKDLNSGKFLIIEFSPDNTEEMNYLSDLVFSQQDSPSLRRCVELCREAAVRARVMVAGQYIGHIFADGSCDRGVQNLL